MRSAIIDASIKSKSDEIYLDLSEFTDAAVKKSCFQRQYMARETFVELTKMESPNFPNVDEGEFVLWIYFESRQPIQIGFKFNEVLPPKDGGLCFESSTLHISQQRILSY